VISPRLLSLVRCPECHGPLTQAAAALTCASCGRTYGAAAGDFLDLRPRVAFEERTRYLDEALHADARHERVSPPLLGSKIRNDMLRAYLAPAASDVVVDLGCGSGRALVWNRDWGSTTVGVDIAPFFAKEARHDVDLVIGDLRRLPFADATFTKAYSLDVLEHLSPDALRAMLAEAARVIAPGGSLFVYTHVRRNARIAVGLRWINALARQLDRAGLIDLRQEHLRKSDHLNPLADIPELRRLAGETGFRIARIRYYTPIVGGFVENIVVRLAERQMARRAARRLSSELGTAAADREAIKEARTAAKARIATSATTRAAFRVLTAAMKLDLLLFGSIESGPFFALLQRVPAASGHPAGETGTPRTSDLESRTSAAAARASRIAP
jgi:SAM-dependent methyltransferase